MPYVKIDDDHLSSYLGHTISAYSFVDDAEVQLTDDIRQWFFERRERPPAICREYVTRDDQEHHEWFKYVYYVIIPNPITAFEFRIRWT